MLKSILIFTVLCSALCSTVTYNEVSNITGNDPDFPFYGEMFTGFITVDNSTGAKLYYHLYAVNGTNLSVEAPVGIWLQGGPGCSSALGNFGEIGPVFVGGSPGNYVFEQNPYTWNQWLHLIFIDQPTGSGFSPSFGLNVSSSWQSAAQFNVFLARFYQLFPMLQDNGLYLFGESYAGKFIPTYLYYLSTNATFANSTPIRGFALGDGWSDPVPQTMTYSTFGYATGCLDQLDAQVISDLQIKTFTEANHSNYWMATNYSNWAGDELNSDAGGTNGYDYREYSSNFGEYSSWLNTTAAQEFLEVPLTQFSDCNSDVGNNFYDDTTESIAWAYPYLFSKYNVMFYNGQDDNNCDYEGVNNYLGMLNWTDVKNFRKAPRQPWHFPNGTIAGLVKSYGNVTFAFVYKAGHMVPFYQPEAAAIAIYNYLNRQPFN